jgi:UDP-N-acetylglucosamine 2-epimerase (non-hydrolysing)
VVSCPGIILLEPAGYIEMLRLNLGARIMLTDSGGLQEESCVLGTPCMTLRENTERPITLREHGGTCALAGNDTSSILALFSELKALRRCPFRPPLWDGHTAERVVEVIGA